MRRRSIVSSVVIVMSSLFLSVGVGAAADAIRPAPIPADAAALQAKLAARLSPDVRRWVAEQATKVRQGSIEEGMLRGGIQARFAGQLSNANDIEAVVFIVLMQAAKDAEEDLKAIMAQGKATTEAKQKLRGGWPG